MAEEVLCVDYVGKKTFMHIHNFQRRPVDNRNIPDLTLEVPILHEGQIYSGVYKYIGHKIARRHPGVPERAWPTFDLLHYTESEPFLVKD